LLVNKRTNYLLLIEFNNFRVLKFLYNKSIRYYFIGLLLSVLCFEGHAQKDLSRTYSAKNLENITIDANGVHTLKITATPTEEIAVNVHLEGETSEEIVVKEHMEGAQLALGFGSWPFAKTIDDKLAAHKIVSVEVTLSIPEDLVVSITSNTASVAANGVFEILYVDIEDKNCVLTSFTGDANLKTKSGTIKVKVQNNTTVAKAITTYGTVQNNLGDKGVFTIYAESLYGDISLQQTQ
jgi:hypothetical protein